MSKLCTRDYGGNSLLSAKMINGLPHCPLCEKPVLCHGRDIATRALFWALAGETGISSEAIEKHMLGFVDDRMSPPSDASDRGRCIRLLELIPEWIPRLPEMVQYDVQREEGIVINASGLHTQTNGWEKQIPLILREGRL